MISHLDCRDIKDTTVGTLSQRITNQVHGLKGLNSKLLDIRSYLERVAAGKLPINHQIIYQLQDVFNLLPDVNLLVSHLWFTDRRPFMLLLVGWGFVSDCSRAKSYLKMRFMWKCLQNEFQLLLKVKVVKIIRFRHGSYSHLCVNYIFRKKGSTST